MFPVSNPFLLFFSSVFLFTLLTGEEKPRKMLRIKYLPLNAFKNFAMLPLIIQNK